MDAREAAERWRETWERCWCAHEADEIVALYAQGACFQSHPHREPTTPREYIEPTLADEESADCEFGEPLVEGDRAVVAWHAKTTLKGGDTERLNGLSLLRFDEHGLVVEQRDFWARA